MHLVTIAWIYVALMAAIAEATSSGGTVLGAVFTFVLYGVLPLAIVLYLLGAPARHRAVLRREREAQEAARSRASAATGERAGD